MFSNPRHGRCKEEDVAYPLSDKLRLNISFRKDKIMNATKLNLKGNWNVVKGKPKQAYGELTDDDLKFAEGQEDELVGRIQKRIGATAADVQHLLEKFNRP